MQKKLGLIILAAIIVITGITVVAHQHSNKTMNNMPMNSSAAANQNATASNNVTIENYAFSAATIKVKAGTTVTWTNQDSVHHTVTMDSGSNGPKSGDMAKGQKYSFTFKTAGTYTYHCAIHPSMHGTVLVT